MIKNFPGSQRDQLIVAGLAVLVLILGYWRMVPEVCGCFHDDGIYLITAKALAQGQGYRLTYLPDAPLQTKYPILYPAILAVIWKLWPSFPDNLFLMKWFTLVCGAASIGLSYLYLIRFGYFSRSIAGLSALICATSPMFLYYSTLTLSEAPFALLAILAMWAFEAQREGAANQETRQLFLGILLALPFLCRTVGVSLVLAGLLIQYFRGRPLRWMGLGMAAIILPWLMWMAMGLGSWSRDPISGYYTDYFGWWAAMGWSLGLHIIGQNFLNLLISNVIVMLAGLNEIIRPVNLWGLTFIVFFIGSTPLIVLIAKLRTWRLLPFFMFSYLLLILIWPWHPFRFLIPILPFLLSYFFEGISNLCKRCKIRTWSLLPIGLLLVATNLNLLYACTKQASQFGYPHAGLVKNPAPWNSYKDIFYWLKIHSQPDDVIASWEDPMIFLYTGRRAIRPFRINPGFIGYGKDLESYGSAEKLFQTLKTYQARYLVGVPVFTFDQNLLDDLISEMQQKYPGLLKRVYTGKDKRFVVFELPGQSSR
jgi:hypothetical protein